MVRSEISRLGFVVISHSVYADINILVKKKYNNE